MSRVFITRPELEEDELELEEDELELEVDELELDVDELELEADELELEELGAVPPPPPQAAKETAKQEIKINRAFIDSSALFLLV